MKYKLKKLGDFIKCDKYIIKITSVLILFYIIYSRSHPSSDQLTQIGSAFNFIKGHGFSNVFFDGKQLVFQSLDSWPKFYSLLIAFFLKISKDTNVSFLCVEFTCYAVFLIAIYKTLTILLKGSSNKNLVLNLSAISLATSIAPFKYGSGVDVISVAFMLLSIVFLYKYYFEKLQPKYLVIVYSLIALLCHVRYDYLPKVLMLFVFILAVEILQKTYKKHVFYKVLLSSFFGINFLYIFLSDFFQKTSARSANLISSGSAIVESYWNYLYAPFFNSFFPDFILFTFLSKISKTFISENYLLFIVPLSFISIIILYSFKINIKLKSLLNINKENFLPLALLFLAMSNLVTLFVVYGTNTFYQISWIQNPYQISYSGLSVVNRYFLLLHVSIFFLSAYNAFELKNLFFKSLIIPSICFGIFHFGYLNTRYSIFKSENLKLVSSPSEIYVDCMKINSLLRSVNKENNLFIPISKLETVYNRQIKPSQIAFSNGFVIFNSKDSLTETIELNSKFDNIYTCSYTKKSVKKIHYETIYRGEIYSLHKKINDQQ